MQAEGAEIFFETPCVQLLVEDGRVAGAIGETKDGAHVLLRANKGVIMASGDYVGDTEMLYYYTPDAKGLHQAVDFRNGTGLKAAMWAGAQMCPASHTKMVHGEGFKVRFEMPYLFLDRHGKRFMDEGCCRMGYLNEFTNKYLAEVDFAESTAAKFFSVVPTNWQEHYDAWKDFSDISIHNAYRDVDPEAWIKGDTLEELAQNMIAYADEEGWAHNYTVEAIVESINRYNELVAAGNGDEDFGKRDEYMVPIEAPCYAVPRGANNIDALVDGLWCDGNFQCLDADMKPIEGLFAVGNVSGPFFGNSNYRWTSRACRWAAPSPPASPRAATSPACRSRDSAGIAGLDCLSFRGPPRVLVLVCPALSFPYPPSEPTPLTGRRRCCFRRAGNMEEAGLALSRGFPENAGHLFRGKFRVVRHLLPEGSLISAKEELERGVSAF
ncbi:MAG: FAD-binding protein [Coriobacteriaceae bacterium]